MYMYILIFFACLLLFFLSKCAAINESVSPSVFGKRSSLACVVDYIHTFFDNHDREAMAFVCVGIMGINMYICITCHDGAGCKLKRH